MIQSKHASENVTAKADRGTARTAYGCSCRVSLERLRTASCSRETRRMRRAEPEPDRRGRAARARSAKKPGVEPGGLLLRAAWSWWSCAHSYSHGSPNASASTMKSGAVAAATAASASGTRRKRHAPRRRASRRRTRRTSSPPKAQCRARRNAASRMLGAGPLAWTAPIPPSVGEQSAGGGNRRAAVCGCSLRSLHPCSDRNVPDHLPSVGFFVTCETAWDGMLPSPRRDDAEDAARRSCSWRCPPSAESDGGGGTPRLVTACRRPRPRRARGRWRRSRW